MFFVRREPVITVIIFLVIATIFDLRESGISYAPRRSSINLGGGLCEWTPATADVPKDIEFYKTLVTGFPSGDKRLTFVQMEGLTGLASRDEWDFAYLGVTNQPFVKANYPHHEGIDGWAGVDLGQVALVVRNIKSSLIEYHDILWDIGYAQDYEQASARMDGLYEQSPPTEDFIKWRNLRIHDEIHWYSWFIDYYMEGGLLRDIFTHERTTQEHWDMLILPNHYSKDELRYANFVDDPTTVPPAYDPLCMTIDRGCYPVRIISGEKLIDHSVGPAEGRKIAELIWGKEGFDAFMIDPEAWQCIWNELIIKKKGLKTFDERVGSQEGKTFTFEMENEMWYELERLITKYDGHDDSVAKDLVALLREHQGSLGITNDPSKRLTYEELMTYQRAFPAFFPEQAGPENFWADPYSPRQKRFGSNHPSAVPSNIPSISVYPTTTPSSHPTSNPSISHNPTVTANPSTSVSNKPTYVFDQRMLKNSDVMGPRIGAQYERKNVRNDDFVLSAEDQEEHVFSNENHEFERRGLREITNTAPWTAYDWRTGMTRDDIAAHFRRADEILRQRRLQRFEHINSVKGLYGV